MSDFDKEAEREKLREKYERDEAKRETTEQMSELLLKGATMTNAHCGDCGDPIFRYDGQEFCPTCQKPVDRGAGGEAGAGGDDGASAESDAGNGENGQPQGGIEVTSPSDEATVQFGGEEVGDAGDRADDGDQGTPAADTGAAGVDTDQPESSPAGGRDANRREIPSADPSNTRNSGSSVNDSPAEPNATPRPSTGASRQPDGTASDHLGSAQVVLAQTVERFARRAAETDDPRAAREHLETAREAAQTLEATRF